MNEVTKLYENAEIKSKVECTSKVCIVTNPHKDWCNKCESLKYENPPFTAEKQIKLIKWLSKRCFYIEISEMANKSYGIAFKYQPADEYKNEQSECCTNKNFTEALAESINYIWQDLTEEERKQIKNILESEVRE